MKVIVPQAFSPSTLTSSGFTETLPVWNSGTTYAAGTSIIYPAPGGSEISIIYESTTTTGNLNKLPDEVDSTYWFPIKSSNRYAMFDNTVNNQSVFTGGAVTLDLFLPVGISALTFINSDFGSVDVAVYKTSPSGQLFYRRQFNIPTTSFLNWYDYATYNYVGERIPITFTDIVNIADTYLRITFLPNPNTNEVRVGELIYGTLSDLGVTQRGITSGIVDYSIKETDSFGNINFVERNFSKRFTSKILVENKKLNTVQKVLYSLRAKPAVWIADEDVDIQEATVVFGFYKDFSAELVYPTYSYYNLEIEGLV